MLWSRFSCYRGDKRRSIWSFAHWVLGTTVSLLGIINIYTGLHAYHKKTSRRITLWVIFYTAEIVCIGFLYLFQEKWEYIQNQGVIRGNEPTTTIQPTDNQDILAKQNKDSCWPESLLSDYVDEITMEFKLSLVFKEPIDLD